MKIAVIGDSGTGKTMLARALGEKEIDQYLEGRLC